MLFTLSNWVLFTKSSVDKLEKDITLTNENNEALEHQFNSFKQLILTHFADLKLPNFGPVNDDNIEDFVTKLLEQSKENSQLEDAIKNIVSNLDLTSLTTSSEHWE